MITETNLFSILQFLESKNGGLSPDPFPPLSLTDVCEFPFYPPEKARIMKSITFTAQFAIGIHTAVAHFFVFSVFFNSKYKAVVIKQTWWYKQYFFCSLKRIRRKWEDTQAIMWCMYNLLQHELKEQKQETVYRMWEAK